MSAFSTSFRFESQPVFSPDQPPEFSFRDWLDSLPPFAEPAFSINLEELNPAQRADVTHSGSPLLVIAGAGTGKTRTLVCKLAHLLAQGVSAESILLLTFTRKAAQEMLSRAVQLTPQASRVEGGTFHSVASLLLRRCGHLHNINSDFTIIDQSDSESIIALLASSLRLSGSGRSFPSARLVFNFISAAVNKSCSIDEAVLHSHPHLIDHSNDFYLILEHYSDFKVEHNLMDYDDLLIYCHQLLTECPAAADIIRSQFSHVLVDEYQDTNSLQSMIVASLAGNVTAVGDDAQSIYGFRGADHQHIMRFPEHYPGCAVIKLEQNYRSTPEILDLANAVMAKASKQYSKRLFTRNSGSGKPVLHAADNEAAEACWVVSKIRELIRSGTSPSGIAVLFRASYHAYKLELELAAEGISFEKWGGMKVTESAHVKDMLSFFRILVNPQDSLAWHRLLLQIEKIGPKTAEKILGTIMAHEDPFQALSVYPASPGFAQGLRAFSAALEAMRLPGLSPFSIFVMALDYYQPILERIHHEDHPARLRDLERIRALVYDYEDMRSLVDEMVLNAQAAAGDGLTLVLSTVHSFKGREADAVFVLGCSEHRFPACSEDSPAYEEERRLFNVAVTRARKKLFLTWPKMLIGPDRSRRSAALSPFLQEIDPALFDLEEE